MKRFLSRFLVVGVALGSFGVVGAANAGATPTLNVTPSTGLTNAQKVTVTGSGFNPGDTLAIVECNGTATTLAGCDALGYVSLTVASDGTLPSTPFTVSTGTIGNGTCGTSTADLNCLIVIGTLSGTLAGEAQITFAAPGTATATSTTTTTTPVVVATPRTLHVSPSTGLRNGTAVHVSGSGFTPGDHVYILQCLVGATSQAACNVANLKPVTITSSGALPSTVFHVVAGKIGTGVCGTTRANLNLCDISVANATQGDAKFLRITFALPKKG